MSWYDRAWILLLFSFVIARLMGVKSELNFIHTTLIRHLLGRPPIDKPHPRMWFADKVTRGERENGGSPKH